MNTTNLPPEVLNDPTHRMLEQAQREQLQFTEMSEANRKKMMSGEYEVLGSGNPSVIKDSALSVVRGALDFTQGIYDTADMLPFIELPEIDFKEATGIGKAETVVGGIIEGVTDFALAFVPIAGQVGKISKVSKLAKAGTALKLLKPVTKAGEETLKLTLLGETALSGGIAATVGFNRTEERFSNMLVTMDNPLLNNAVTRFLAADEDDSQAMSRFKNALEDIGLGLALDAAILVGAKSIKAGKAVLAKGGTQEEAQAAAAAVAKAENLEQVAQDVRNEAINTSVEEQVSKGTTEWPAGVAPKGSIDLSQQGGVSQVDRIDLKAMGYTDEQIDAMSPEGVAKAQAAKTGAAPSATAPASATAPTPATAPYAEVTTGLKPEDALRAESQTYRGQAADNFLLENGVSKKKVKTSRIAEKQELIYNILQTKQADEFLLKRGYTEAELKAQPLEDKLKEIELAVKQEQEKAAQAAPPATTANVSDQTQGWTLGEFVAGLSPEAKQEITERVNIMRDTGDEGFDDEQAMVKQAIEDIRELGENSGGYLEQPTFASKEDRSAIRKARSKWRRVRDEILSKADGLKKTEGSPIAVKGSAGVEVIDRAKKLETQADTAAAAAPAAATTAPAAATPAASAVTKEQTKALISSFLTRDASEVLVELSMKDRRLAINLLRNPQELMIHLTDTLSEMFGKNVTVNQKEMVEQALKTFSAINGRLSPEELMRYYKAVSEKASIAGKMPNIEGELLTKYFAADSSAKMAADLLEKVAADPTDALVGELHEVLGILAPLVKDISDVGSATGRLLKFVQTTQQALGTSPGSLKLNAKRFLQLDRKDLDQLLSTPQGRAQLQRVALALKGENPLKQFAKINATTKFFGITVEMFMSSLLSSPKSVIRNAVGSLQLLYKPAEQALGAKIAALQVKDPELAKQLNTYATAALRQYSYLMTGVGDAWDMMIKNWKTGETVFEGSEAVTTLRKSKLSAEYLKENPEGAVAEYVAKYTEAHPAFASMMDYAGQVTKIPFRANTSVDMFVRHLSANSMAKVRLAEEALGKGIPENEIAEYVAKRMSQLQDESGKFYSRDAIAAKFLAEAKEKGVADVADYVNSALEVWDGADGAILRYADEYSQRIGFAQKPKKPGQVSGINPFTGKETNAQYNAAVQQKIGEVLDSHPLFKLVVPFYNTPMGILNEVGGYLPTGKFPLIGKAQRQYTEDILSGDTAKIAAAEGKFWLGLGVVTMGANLGFSGRITGGGPQNEGERKALMATGWQPYSIVFKDGDKTSYISFQGAEPFASILGIFGDIGEHMKRNNSAYEPRSVSRLITGVGVAMKNNVVNHSYMAGLKNVMDSIADTEHKGDKFIKGIVRGFIPAGLRNAAGAFGDDPYMREARTYTEMLLSSTPFTSKMVDPRRNILGEPVERKVLLPVFDWVNPFIVSTKNEDKLMLEMANLQSAFTEPRPTDFGEGLINLVDYKNESGQSAFDRYLELTGSITLNKRTLREELERLIDSKEYNSYEQFTKIGRFDSPRAAAIRKVISKYRKAAKQQMRDEFPDVDNKLSEIESIRNSLKQGEAITPEDLFGRLAR